MRRWRGLKSLVHDAVDRVTDLVGEGHESTARTILRVTDRVPSISKRARAVNEIRRISTRGVLGSIKIVNRAVRVASDLGLDLATTPEPEELHEPVPAVPMRSDAIDRASWVGDAALGLVNAVIGDHLHARDNGLDMGMVFRVGDHYVPIDAVAIREAGRTLAPKVALYVHGLGTTEWSWCLEALAYHGDSGTTFGSMLERDRGFTPIWLRYNTGRHVSENGRLLARELERFVHAYEAARGGPIEELALIGHSMGGLVVRSACHYAEMEHYAANDGRWPGLVKNVICLGSPHQGAPLEKLGNLLTGVLGAIDLPGTLIPARLLEGRSAGIKDLRHGSIIDEHWLGKDPDALRDEERAEVPLLAHATHHFVSATLTRDPEHPLGRLIGDLLVRVPSSAGPKIAKSSFAVETSRFGGVMHHQLQNHPAVYAVVRDALA